MNLPLSIMYFGGKCAPNDAKTLQDISQNFVDIISQTDFAEICTKNKLCTAEHVDVGCGAANSRKKRALLGTTKGSLSHHDNITTVFMVSVRFGYSLISHNRPCELFLWFEYNDWWLLYNVDAKLPYNLWLVWILIQIRG